MSQRDRLELATLLKKAEGQRQRIVELQKQLTLPHEENRARGEPQQKRRDAQERSTATPQVKSIGENRV